jgi:hypothetical protein
MSKILTIEQATVYTITRCYAKHFTNCSDLVLSNLRYAGLKRSSAKPNLVPSHAEIPFQESMAGHILPGTI